MLEHWTKYTYLRDPTAVDIPNKRYISSAIFQFMSAFQPRLFFYQNDSGIGKTSEVAGIFLRDACALGI
jgi:hypothetical protein